MKIWIFILVVVGSLLGSLAVHADEQDSSILLGGIFCLTGEIASGCNAIKEGAEIALDLINAAGGVNGHPLQLDIQDSHYNSKDSHSLAVRFANNKRLLGVLITGIVETKAAAASLEKAGIPYLTLWDSAPAIEQLGDFSFGIGPWLPATYELSAEFAFAKLQLRKAAVVSTSAEWSIGVAQGFVKQFKMLGGSIVSFNEVLPHEADFRAMLARVLAAKPDVIYAPITSHIIPFFAQLRQLGYSGPVITSDNLTEDLIAQGGAPFEGVFQTMVADPENPEAEHLKSLYRRKFGREPTMLAFHGWGYDGVRLMADALQKISNSPTRRLLRDTLLQTRGFRGVGGTIHFSAEGSWRMPLKVFEVRQGKLLRRD